MYLTTEFDDFQHGKAEVAGAKMELFPSIKLTDWVRVFGVCEFISTRCSGGVEASKAWLGQRPC